MNPVTRRRFLESGSLAAVALLGPRAAKSETLPYDDGNSNIPGGVQGPVERVVVIGAGFAGLTVANALQNAGVDVVVLEARPRLGGRTHTETVGSVPVDLGAAWIHSTLGNPVATFAQQVGIPLFQNDLNLAPFSAFDAQIGSISEADTELALSTASDFQSDLDRLRALLGPSASVADGIVRHLNDEGLTGDERRVVEFMVRSPLVELPYAGAASELSLAWYFEDLGFGGFDHLPVGGYRGLVDAMAQGVDVRPGEVVTDLVYGGSGVTVTTASGLFTGSHAVVTVPLGVLKAGSIQFSPALPASKLNSISALGVGGLERVILRFSSAFWQATRDNFLYLSNTQGEYPLFVDWTAFTGQPTLMCEIGGQFARDMASMSESAITARVLAILAEIFGGSVPTPIDVAISRWWSDPFSAGAYATIPVGASPADLDSLAQPVAGRVLFAGEATQSDFYGTVHAAMLSGIREGKRLLQTPTVLIPEAQGWLVPAAALGVLAMVARLRRSRAMVDSA